MREREYFIIRNLPLKSVERWPRVIPDLVGGSVWQTELGIFPEKRLCTWSKDIYIDIISIGKKYEINPKIKFLIITNLSFKLK